MKSEPGIQEGSAADALRSVWAIEDTAQLMESCDRVFGTVTILAGLVAGIFWALGSVGVLTPLLLLALPLLNLPLSLVASAANRFRVERARLLINLAVTSAAYALMDGPFERFWLLCLLGVTGQALIWPVLTRRETSGHIVTLLFVGALLLVSAVAFDEPRWGEAGMQATALLLVGFVTSKASARLSGSIVVARQQHRVAANRAEELDAAVARLAEAQERLVGLSRSAGMAEVATGVLHDVGNLLNSVNVSTQLIHESLQTSRLRTLRELSRLLAEHSGDLHAFLARDERGQSVVPLLALLSDHLEAERQALLGENREMRKRLEHIQGLVGRHHDYERTDGSAEACTLRQLVDDALTLSAGSRTSGDLDFVRELQPTPELLIDRHRALHILVNLVTHARRAVPGDGRPRQLTIRGGLRSPGRFFVEVVEHTLNIAPAGPGPQAVPLVHAEGSGSALRHATETAAALGGVVLACGPGQGRGACLTVELPMQPPSGRRQFAA